MGAGQGAGSLKRHTHRIAHAAVSWCARCGALTASQRRLASIDRTGPVRAYWVGSVAFGRYGCRPLEANQSDGRGRGFM